MDNNERYFVALMASYLNGEKPTKPENTDFNEIYKLAQRHDVTAIAAQQIIMLDDCDKPDKKTLSAFKQQLGKTIIADSERESAAEYLRSFFEKNEIEFMFVKGAVIKDYYPTKELRTSGDIDVIIRGEDLKRCIYAANLDSEIINKDADKTIRMSVFTVSLNNVSAEIHTNNDYDHPFFKDIFDYAVKKDGSFEYRLKDEYHLLYILCHIIKHFNQYGAGIRMFMDIDVFIRRLIYFDYNTFFQLCNTLNIKTFSKCAFSLCKYWFSTPIDTDYDIKSDKNLLDLFEKEILSGGSFTTNNRNSASIYIAQGVGNSEKNDSKAKLRALFHFIFPKREYLENCYHFAQKHPILLPIAWCMRTFGGLFKRFSHAKGTVKTIMNSSDDEAEYKKLLNELDI